MRSKCYTLINTIIILTFHATITMNAITLIGHRGAAALAPENTISSFQKAIECNVDIIEFDVRKCASGELVVFHDAKVDRITNGTGFVYHKTLSELKTLKVMGHESIPTLHQACDYIDRRAKIYIELKSLDIVYDILDVIDYYVKEKNWLYSDFLVASFDHMQLDAIKKINPSLIIAALIYGIPIAIENYLAQLKPEIVCLDIEFITQEMIENIHQYKIPVYVFTVNDKEDMQKCIAWNVDGIITDDPMIIKLS